MRFSELVTYTKLWVHLAALYDPLLCLGVIKNSDVAPSFRECWPNAVPGAEAHAPLL